jgi:hypothetical protein
MIEKMIARRRTAVTQTASDKKAPAAGRENPS